MSAPVALYGANGHTGRLVAEELSRRGHEMILAGRSLDALHAVGAGLETQWHAREVHIDDHRALGSLTESAAVLINCAGPYSSTGKQIAGAAVENGCHYLDHAADPFYLKMLFETYAESAKAADVTLIPGISFFGAIADLLAATVTEDQTDVDLLTIAYSLQGWRMTTASKATAIEVNSQDRIVYTDGAARISAPDPDLGSFEFPLSIGVRPVLQDYPAGEVLTIPRHVAVNSIRVMMTADTFAGDEVFSSEDISTHDRAQSEFLVVAEARTKDRLAARYARGTDIYSTGARVSVEAADRLVRGQTPSGVLSASEAFEPSEFLGALERQGIIERSPDVSTQT